MKKIKPTLFLEKIQINEQGFGIIAAILIILIVSVAGLTVVSLLGTDTSGALNYMHSQQALFVAESGIRYFIRHELIGDADWSDNTSVVTQSFGRGTFTVTPRNQTQTQVSLRSTGSITQGGLTFTRTSDYTVDMSAVIAAFSGEYAIYGEGSVDFDHINNGRITGADVYLGGTFNANYTSNFIVDSDIYQNQSGADIPQVDWAYWQSVANYVISGDYTFSGTTYTGIYYVNGNVTLNRNNLILNGTIISTGNITMTSDNNVTFNPDAERPALVAGGSIYLDQCNNVVIGGPIYAGDSIVIDQGNNMTINGPVVFGNEFEAENINNITIDLSDTLITRGFTGGQQIISSQNCPLSNFDEIY